MSARAKRRRAGPSGTKLQTARRASERRAADWRRNERNAQREWVALQRRRFAKNDDNGSSRRRVREASLKRKGGDPEGESGSPLGLLGSRFEVVGAWGLRSQDRLPPQLGNGMTLDLTDALCGDTPDRTDIGELGLTAVDESIAAANDVGGALVQ